MRKKEIPGETRAQYIQRYQLNRAAELGITLKEFRKLVREKTATNAGMSVQEYTKKTLENTAKKKGFNSAKEYSKISHVEVAAAQGLTTSEYNRQKLTNRAASNNMAPAEYVNLTHTYRKHRGDSCENTDGRLGFVCTTNVVWTGMLDIDHIDGNPTNNNKENLQTLCKCCHAFKTNREKDFASLGRKGHRALKIAASMVDN